MRRHLILIGLLALACIAVSATHPVTASAADEDDADGDDASDSEDAGEDAQYELVYKGEFIDQESQPISGVFPLEFRLYADEKSRRSMWKEKHYVSVVNGSYTVPLGRKNPLPPRAAREAVELGIFLDGRQVVRQPLKAKLVSEEVRIGMQSSTSQADYAEQAGEAERLGGFGPDDFARASQIAALEKQIKDLKSSMSGQGGGGGSAGVLGNQSWQSQYGGGSGGHPFTLSCPDGYVMTGIEGRSGRVVDALRIVCKKLE